MKLEKILDKLGSLEKNAFIKIIDNIISYEPSKNQDIEKILSDSNKDLKTVDSQNIANIFSIVESAFIQHIKNEFQEVDSQLDIVIDIIIRDGNCIMKQDWFSRLYDLEIKNLKAKTKKLIEDLENEKSEITDSRKRDYRIYKSCLQSAYSNDLSINRDSKITADEASIILTLAKELGLSQEEIKLINYSILPIKKIEILDLINSLKNIGILFFSKKENSVYVADEVVRLLRNVRQKEVADKFLRRTLKIFKEPIINQISKNHNIDRKLNNYQKIEEIIKEGASFSTILLYDIHKENSTLTEKKRMLTDFFDKGLEIKNLKGTTLEEKISNLIIHFELIEKDEKVGISLDGFEKLLNDLNISLPSLNKLMKTQFEMQQELVLKAEFLLDYNIKPRDILDLINKDDLSFFIKENGIKQRGDDILNILDHYTDVENLLLENYENIAYRNLNVLKDNSIFLKESELGLKFEELTKVIFSGLGFNVDEKFKKQLNTKKDMIDILINLENNQVIIVECKTIKEKGYNKFSSVSRQLKSYQNLAILNNLTIAKIILVAPEFSDDFVTDCEMDIEMNLSLLNASTLMKIYNAFKDSKHKVFPHVLFRDVVINGERIIKVLNK